MGTFFIQQFGCRASQADGAAIERQLREQGCTLASDSSSADVVVLNTCTVTAAADAQARDAIRKIHAANPATRILVTGCYAQRAPEEIAALPGVTFVVGNSHKPQIPRLLHSIAPLPHLRSHENQFVGAELAPSVRSAQQELPPHPAPIPTRPIFQLTDVLVDPVLCGRRNPTLPTLMLPPR